MATKKRLLNIAKRMLFRGEVFYAKVSPRMTWSEYLELSKLGFFVQSEHPHPPECRMYYMPSYHCLQNTEAFNKASSPIEELPSENNDQDRLAIEVCPTCIGLGRVYQDKIIVGDVCPDCKGSGKGV